MIRRLQQEDAQIKCPVRGFHWDPRRRTWFKREPVSPYSPDYKEAPHKERPLFGLEE